MPGNFTAAFYLFISAPVPRHPSALKHWESVSKALWICASEFMFLNISENSYPLVIYWAGDWSNISRGSSQSFSFQFVLWGVLLMEFSAGEELFYFYTHYMQFKCHLIKSCLWTKHLKANVNCPKHFSPLSVLRLLPETKDLMDFLFFLHYRFLSHACNKWKPWIGEDVAFWKPQSTWFIQIMFT